MKKIKLRKYIPERDFIRIRDFLNETYCAFNSPVNWGLERWNYARFFISPMLGAYGLNSPDNSKSIAAIKLWEDLLGVWENEAGKIVGVANIEHAHTEHRGFGEIFIQRHPDYLFLMEEMLEYGEKNFLNKQKKQVHIFVYEDDEPLLELIQKRGYEKREEVSSSHLEYQITGKYNWHLPHGFTLHTMQGCDRIAERCEIFGRSFNHPNQEDWPSVFSYQELQKAPDYYAENDFFITAENDKMVAQAIVWYDEVNKIGHLEPLGTHPDHRGKKLAQELMNACFARLQELGATKMPMTGGFDPFYKAIGFKKKRTCYAWIKKM
ncbi:MAG: GNAT family N-acetyltransferase [Candidatus Cloacimonetes bacterium]|nr:GNAT family N-acetyltransferase [Candidatus Cloacimonadota bacterium]MCF7815239.1 GNAT family N-acetyltransferase [Candidatus Cloacimonadota bacterium]MCF7867318.1 GNAT family N-acetyltransferase [Candidatus Cloacimonadota bacterium]MCF7884708.1 GNAT family N-acetyltransferase [Candidatus Cloacimonadota bacterium]